MGTDMATPLSDHDDLIVYLFTLLTEKQCFLKAATLIEDILGVRTQMFRLQDIRKSYFWTGVFSVPYITDVKSCLKGNCL